MWSGQSGDVDGCYNYYRRWRFVVFCPLGVVAGVLCIVNRESPVPFSDSHLQGWQGIAEGIVLIAASVAWFVLRVKWIREGE